MIEGYSINFITKRQSDLPVRVRTQTGAIPQIDNR